MIWGMIGRVLGNSMLSGTILIVLVYLGIVGIQRR